MKDDLDSPQNVAERPRLKAASLNEKPVYTIESRQMLVCDKCGPVIEVIGNWDTVYLDQMRNEHEQSAHSDLIFHDPDEGLLTAYGEKR